MTVLLDSVILIDHFNGVAAATAYLREARGQSVISAVTRAEVLAGVGVENAPLVKRFLDRFPILAIDREAADLAADLRREHRWRLPDAFQAALARLHRLKLVTRNTKDFPREKFDFVVVPYAR